MFISRLTGEYATQNLRKTYSSLVYGHGDILWTYQEAKIKMMILDWLCRVNWLAMASRKHDERDQRINNSLP